MLRNQELQAQVDALKLSDASWIQQRQQKVEQLNKTISELNRQVQQGEGRPDQPLSSTSDTSNIVAAERRLPYPPERMQRSQAMTAQISASEWMGFIERFSLSTEKKAMLEKRFLDAFAKRQNDSFAEANKLKSGEITAEQQRAMTSDSIIAMRNEVSQALSEFLTPEQVATFRAWQTDPQRQKEQFERQQAQFESRIATEVASAAPALTESNQGVLTAILVNTSSKFKYGIADAQTFEQAEITLQDVGLSKDQMQIAREFLRSKAKLYRAWGQ
ncbi:MAG TPA: hypothetical protein VMH83_03255 [Candidatus Acidoferrum sp.]|nr:hypothetical protein [Candidatus Acidoferrum sp.]